MAKFVLINKGKTNVDFTVFTPAPEGTELLSKHKQRKAKNSGNIRVVLKPNTSVDLIKVTGLSVDELLDNVEVRELVRVKTDKVEVVIETDDAILEDPTPEVKPEPPKEAPKAPKVEPPKMKPVPPPPVKEEPKTEKKSSKKSKKK